MSRETAFFLQADAQFRISLKRVVITDDVPEKSENINNTCKPLTVCASPGMISGSSSSNFNNNGCFQTKLSSPALSSSSANLKSNQHQQQQQQVKSSSFTGQL